MFNHNILFNSLTKTMVYHQDGGDLCNTDKQESSYTTIYKHCVKRLYIEMNREGDR